MKSVRINFNGPNKLEVDWSSSADGLQNVTQRAALNLISTEGSDYVVPYWGGDLRKDFQRMGAYNFVAAQHALNFAALKIRKDLARENAARTPENQVSFVELALLELRNDTISTSLRVTNAAGQSTQQITTTV